MYPLPFLLFDNEQVYLTKQLGNKLDIINSEKQNKIKLAVMEDAEFFLPNWLSAANCTASIISLDIIIWR